MFLKEQKDICKMLTRVHERCLRAQSVFIQTYRILILKRLKLDMSPPSIPTRSKKSMGEYGLSLGALEAVWLQYGSSLRSLAAFLRIVWRESSKPYSHRCQCRGVWQEYGQSLDSSWLFPD